MDEARSAWDAGEYERVVRLLAKAKFDRREDRVAAAVMHARALLALDRQEQVAPLMQRASKEVKGAEETVLTQMLHGAALTLTNRREQGEALLDETAALAKRSVPQLGAEVAYYRAVSRWSSHHLAEAEEIVEAALPSAKDVHRARLLQLLGWIDVRGENYSAAARQFTAALDELNRAKHPDVLGRARLLHALSIIAAETIDLRLGRLVRREYETNTWSEDTRIERFHVLEYLAWLSLLEGQLGRAWDERQRALSLTVDTAYHASALTSAANIAGVVGDRFSEARYFELAGSLLLRGDQLALDADRRIAMLAFIAAAPTANIDAARKVLTLYERTRPRKTDRHAFEGDRRVEGFELYARGKLAISEGRTQQGIADLQKALDLWSRLTYRLRVAVTANALRVVTGDPQYAQVALDALRSAPNAWLRPALERGSNDDNPLAQLTPAERRVLAELCKGKKAREIASTFDRSFNTINNHTRAIFTAFGVRSRAALVAECARRGILDDVASPR
ncbi:MAG: helix-turn-helix transcriptional regulator [Candidatus Eremiobacteraeota bacterium]|nr:helix-turn-helix transcriptional regulator [Candidatus Eremiobacteraeota bacterium]